MCVVVAAAAAAARYPAALSEANHTARRDAGQSYTDREIAGGNAVLPSQRSMYEARARIPSDATYEVAIGEHREDWPPLAPDHTPTYVRYVLAPRHEAPDADWVVCFNCELGRYPGEVVWRDDEGNALVRRS
jgi:hypothetical protein